MAGKSRQSIQEKTAAPSWQRERQRLYYS